jgi:NAD(P)-dependent dehydrogenase (short-subunit alcohol dehydrogenase family)|tara:strand:+ start:21 stop:791 length:771 start_codon:yes stop_codon:yes gene_type:complete
MNNLNDQTIILAGSTGLIGQKLTQKFLSLGANIIGIDIDKERLEEQRKFCTKSDNSLFIECDITNKDSLKYVFELAEERFNKVNSAVNLTYPKNSEYGKPFQEVTFKSFSDNLSMHLGGYFLFMQYCSKYSIDNNIEFSLVNFSSIYGVMPPRFDLYEDTNMTMPVEYAAIKSGIQHLSKYLSKLTKSSSFRTNCVSPGGILDGQDKKFLERYKKYSRKKGMLDPEDIFGTVVFLCSEESRYICGQNIIIDDGFSL